MRIPLPFPKCTNPACGRSFQQCVHSGCGGLLEIDPSNHHVYCKHCYHSWNIWDSTYLCTCGHSFTALEVKQAVTTMLDISTIAITELEKRQQSIQYRQDLSRSSLQSFLSSFMGKLGSIAGMAIETVLRLFKVF